MMTCIMCPLSHFFPAQREVLPISHGADLGRAWCLFDGLAGGVWHRAKTNEPINFNTKSGVCPNLAIGASCHLWCLKRSPLSHAPGETSRHIYRVNQSEKRG